MADQPDDDARDAATAADEEPFEAPQIGIESQYIKDLSFENPQGPNAAAAVQRNPDVNIEVNTSARALSEGRYEVTLFVRGEARAEGATLFIVELTYGGVFILDNLPDEAVGPVLLIEGARLLFPFARNIVADATRNGGFPPLLINPIDFVELYREQHMSGESGPGNGEIAGEA